MESVCDQNTLYTWKYHNEIHYYEKSTYATKIYTLYKESKYPILVAHTTGVGNNTVHMGVNVSQLSVILTCPWNNKEKALEGPVKNLLAYCF